MVGIMIWENKNWEKRIECASCISRKGLRLRFDSSIHSDVREGCKEFAKWLRCNYDFPIRVVIYVKNKDKIIAKDGDEVYGTFFKPYSYSVEPYGRIAAGDYPELLNELGKESAIAVINKTIAHELTHYYQWLNKIELTPRGEEWQATYCANKIIDTYEESRGFFRDN